MAEKSGKKKTKKAAKAETGVLGNLSATRPTRIGGDRRGATARTSRPASAKPASPKTASTKTAAATRAAASGAKKSSGGKKAGKPKAVKPKVRPAPTPEAAPPAGWQTTDQDGRKSGPPSGPEIVTTAVQAAGELAQIGLTVGSQLLKRATSRLPRP
jgi:hypothetical protein